MDDGLSLEVIKATQTSLGKYVKRPPLSEKLLRKPPFRFLHDIITTVLKTTGFFEGLFDDDELISDNVKDRDSKILFLSKVISILSSTTGKTLAVKPSKIVAGQEPEKTNELLICLAQALDENLSSKEAIRIYKENAKSPQTNNQIQSITNSSRRTVKKAGDAKTLTSKSSEKLSNHKIEPNEKPGKTRERLDTKTKKKDSDTVKNDSQNKKINSSKLVPNKVQIETKSKTLNKSQPNADKSKSTKITYREGIEISQLQRVENNQSENELKLNADSDTSHNNSNDFLNENKKDVTFETPPSIDKNDLELHHHNVKANEPAINDNKDNNGHLDENIIDMSQRNNVTINTLVSDTITQVKDTEREESSNVSVENKITENPLIPPTTASDQGIFRPSTVRPSSSRPGAPRPREKQENYVSDTDNTLLGKVNIIAEHSPNEEEEESSIVIIEQDTVAISDVEEQLDLSSEHGHLVQQILNSQKQFTQTGKTEIEWQFGAQRAKEAQNQEIDTLKYNIQALSRISNPLGKLLDHIQEDVEVMRQELQQWTIIYEDVSKEMLKQKTLNEGALLPLHYKLKQLEADKKEKHEKISDLKILINKNSMRIDKLLAVHNLP